MRARTSCGVVAACLLLVATAGSVSAFADEPSPTATAAGPPAPCAVGTPAAAPPASGMVVGRQPESGELGLPTVQQRRELLGKEMGAAALTGKPLFEVALPGLGFKIDLQGLLMDYAVAGIGPDGKPRLSCLHDLDGVQKFLAGGARPSGAPVSQLPPQPEEK